MLSEVLQMTLTGNKETVERHLNDAALLYQRMKLFSENVSRPLEGSD